MSSEESVRSTLLDDNAREIVKFCKEPRTSSEIIDHMVKKQTSQTPRIYWERIVSDNLRRLEGVKAIEYVAGNRWKFTEEGKRVLEKFFGGA